MPANSVFPFGVAWIWSELCSWWPLRFTSSFLHSFMLVSIDMHMQCNVVDGWMSCASVWQISQTNKQFYLNCKLQWWCEVQMQSMLFLDPMWTLSMHFMFFDAILAKKIHAFVMLEVDLWCLSCLSVRHSVFRVVQHTEHALPTWKLQLSHIDCIVGCAALCSSPMVYVCVWQMECVPLWQSCACVFTAACDVHVHNHHSVCHRQPPQQPLWQHPVTTSTCGQFGFRPWFLVCVINLTMLTIIDSVLCIVCIPATVCHSGMDCGFVIDWSPTDYSIIRSHGWCWDFGAWCLVLVHQFHIVVAWVLGGNWSHDTCRGFCV